MSADPKQLVVVGAGPRGLFCLERLAIELHSDHTLQPPCIQIFEPHPEPGAGPVYDTRQPHYLRLNFANEKIDAWSRDVDVSAPWPRPTFLEFLRSEYPAYADPWGYAPRAFVGEYLSEAFASITEILRSLTTVELHSEAVTRIETSGTAFSVSTENRVVRADEVLVATGHSSQVAHRVTDGSTHSLGPYPIDGPGGVGDVAAGEVVAVRGMGLTAIDVTLALIEGRGGRFEPLRGRPGQLLYHDSATSPLRILPFSRSGRLMVPKDHPIHGPSPTEHDGVVADGLSRIASLDRNDGDLLGTLQDCLAETAAQILAITSGRAAQQAATSDCLNRLLGTNAPARPDAAMVLERSVDVAYGRRSPGPEWALGGAWRRLYPAIVDLFATRALDPQWPRFSRLAAEMERIGFGPPAENAARLLALVRAGVVDLSMAAGPELSIDGDSYLLRGEQGLTRAADHLVEAVLAPPGVGHSPSNLLKGMLGDGLVRQMPDTPGLEVLCDGTCVGQSGQAVTRLAAIGRLTEGCVLGNDTLGRTLHDTPSRWAMSLVGRLRHQAAREALRCA